MERVAFLAVLVLISSLMTGCARLAADSYDKLACQKYHRNWDLDRIYNEE